MRRQHDFFNGTGSLGAVSHWDIDGATTWTLASGRVGVQSFNTDGIAIHNADANLGLPSSFGVYAIAYIETGTKYAGITALSADTSNPGITFRWEVEGQQQYRLKQQGVNDLVIPAAQFIAVGGNTAHVIALNCIYQYTDSNGKAVYQLGCYMDGVLIVTLTRTMFALSGAANHRAGIVGRRETFGVTSPRLEFDLFFVDDLSAVDGEPAPTSATEPTRTPISITDETPSATPQTFPFDISTARVTHHRETRVFAADMGYDVTHPRFANSRRTISAGWVGSEADKATLQTFFDARTGNYEDFNATIRAQGLGTMRVVFASPQLEFAKLSPGAWRTSFDLIEVYT